jgi:hypothetical protein
MRMNTTSENIKFLKSEENRVIEQKQRLRERYIEHRGELNRELREIKKDIEYEENK